MAPSLTISGKPKRTTLDEQIEHAKGRAKLFKVKYFVFRNGEGDHWMSRDELSQNYYSSGNVLVATVDPTGKVTRV